MASNPPSTDTRVISATTDRLLETVEGLLGRPLTDAERLSFTTRLASINSSAVAPGDLITADLFNDLRADINALAMRLALLEGMGAAPVLSRVEPGGVDLPVGSLLTLVGSGLRPDFADTQVLMDNVVVLDNASMNAFNIESDDNRLIFPVPNRFTGLPRPVSVRVRSAGATSNALTIRLAPEAIIQSGNVFVLAPGDALGTILVGNTYTLRWKVISRTRLPATYSFTTSVTEVVGASETLWRNGISLSETGPVELQPFVERVVTMSVKVPAGATSANISMRAANADQSLANGGSPIAFIVGSVAEVSDPRGLVAIRTIPPNFNGSPNPLIVQSVGGMPGLAMRPNGISEIPMELSFPTNDPSAAGDYRFRARVEGQTARWSLGTLIPTGQTNVVLGNAPRFRVPITSSATVDTTTPSFLVVYAEKFVGGATDPALRSFIRIPLIGRS